MDKDDKTGSTRSTALISVIAVVVLIVLAIVQGLTVHEIGFGPFKVTFGADERLDTPRDSGPSNGSPSAVGPSNGPTPSQPAPLPTPMNQLVNPPIRVAAAPSLTSLPIVVPPSPITTKAPVSAIIGTISYPRHATADALSYVDAVETATGTVNRSANEGMLFAGTQLAGSTDGRVITAAMKESVFIYPVSVNNGVWTATVFFGKDESIYSGLVFTLHFVEAATPAVAQQLRSAPGQPFSLQALSGQVRSLDAHAVVRR